MTTAPNSRRIGTVEISDLCPVGFVQNVFDLLGFKPLRMERLTHLDGARYTGCSDKLPEVPDGADIPDYFIMVDVVDDDGIPKEARFVSSPLPNLLGQVVKPQEGEKKP